MSLGLGLGLDLGLGIEFGFAFRFGFGYLNFSLSSGLLYQFTKSLDFRYSTISVKSLFVYSKSEYTLEWVSMSVRPSGRVHDNFRKESQILMKVSTQFSLINV